MGPALRSAREASKGGSIHVVPGLTGADAPRGLNEGRKIA
jgi:hypothetical protein